MLSTYIKDLIKAKAQNDTKTINRIYKDLSCLGMDKTTVDMIIKEECINA